MNNKIAFVVLSNSKYIDVWDILCSSYNKNIGRAKNFDFFLTSDDFQNKNIIPFKPLLYPKNVSWGYALKFIFKNYLKHYDYILFSFDDLIVTGFDFNRFEAIFKTTDLRYLKLNSDHINLSNLLKIDNGLVPLNESDDSYLGSLVFTVVNSSFFNNLIDNLPQDFSPWEYEKLASKYISDKSKSFSVFPQIVTYENLIIKSYVDIWSKFILMYFYNFSYISKRPNLSLCNFIKYRFKLISFNSLKFILSDKLFNKLRSNKV
jgi:hypothetical protein